MKIQADLTAAVINLKRLAAAFCAFIAAVIVLTALLSTMQSTVGSKLHARRDKHAMVA
jgi:hypothetical protein